MSRFEGNHTVETFEEGDDNSNARIDIGRSNVKAEVSESGLKAEASHCMYDGRMSARNRYIEASCGSSLMEGSARVKANLKDGLNAGFQLTAAKVDSKLKTKAGSLNSELSLNVNTGVRADKDGVGVSCGGFGFDFGSKMGIKTPFGGIGWNFSDRR